MEENNAKSQMSIELPENMAQGVYANMVIITHSSSEFVFDFVRIMPGVPQAKVVSRIVMAPEQGKRFLNALSDNFDKYEESFGTIKLFEKMGHPIPMHFSGPTAKA